ncbi:Hypothetical protein NocV09_01500670 [Nannochloropsis oceanica]
MGQGGSKAPSPTSATPTPSVPAPPTTKSNAVPSTISDTKAPTSTTNIPNPRQVATATEHRQGNGSQPSLARKITLYANETKFQLTRKLTTIAEETRTVLERNNTVVSMASTGVHVITDAGIHLPHELHLPKTGLSHPANAALGATTSAIVAASIVSPMITIIDLAIMKSQVEKIGVGQAVKKTAGDLIAGRAKWFPATKIMGGVYFSTYMAANGTEAWCMENGIDYKIPTAIATSVTNIVGVAAKDQAFARMMSKAPSSFPLSSYVLFALRDGLTVTSTFVLKNTVRDHLVEDYNLRSSTADLMASFAVPMLAQIPSSPLHILSMDLYLRKEATWGSRVAEIARGYRNVVTGRVMRIIPAFGVGGVVNDMVKEAFEDDEEDMFLHMDRGPPTHRKTA